MSGPMTEPREALAALLLECVIDLPALSGIGSSPEVLKAARLNDADRLIAAGVHLGDEGLTRRCAKCGSTNIYVRYDAFHDADRLDCKCRECGYQWWDKPLDRERPTEGDSR